MADENDRAVSAPPAIPKAPAGLQPFAEPSLLLPGEEPRDYAILQQMIFDDVQPQTNIE